MNKNLIKLTFAIMFCAFVATDIVAQEDAVVPTNIFITYHCTAENRAAFRDYMETTGVKRFEMWKKSDVFEDYLILFNSFVSANTWDMTILLHFSNFSDVENWQEIEKEYPGGLDKDALRLASPYTTFFADCAFTSVKAEKRTRSQDAVYFVIPYEFKDRASYEDYAKVYVVPQMEGWMKAGILTNYTIYINLYTAGTPWDAQLVLEYKDMEAFGKRNLLKSKVRKDLTIKPDWKLISTLKGQLREEYDTVITKAILPD